MKVTIFIFGTYIFLAISLNLLISLHNSTTLLDYTNVKNKLTSTNWHSQKTWWQKYKSQNTPDTRKNSDLWTHKKFNCYLQTTTGSFWRNKCDAAHHTENSCFSSSPVHFVDWVTGGLALIWQLSGEKTTTVI